MTLEAIHEVDILTDGTITVFLEVTGEVPAVRRSFDEDLPRLVDCEILDTDQTTMVQLRYHPTEFNRAILEIHRSYGVLVQYPMVFVDPAQSSLRVTVAGPSKDIQQLVAETRDLAELTVEAVMEYDHTASRQFHELTTRQREVLLTAYECGYYEVPREATYEDIAAELDCSASSVGQTLRRIESRLVTVTVSNRTGARTET
ncbi:Bacterio-opsin activator HTH domain protein [Natrialba aegyptia DSM 13077]|uniref:Bacterio-opsin activator HTH domain protein n=1 Tax=Natrialba aegyptia DSM 13077 TaxID=1227491 RepID=M0B0M0_9EURY|nr:Bacterio-opsin activator HTH domain protein [Natrialba aegyptia DSM 13077]